MKNLLLVEDNDLYRFALKKQFTDFSITEASTFESAQDAVFKQQFDLAIVDLNLNREKPEQGLEIIPLLNKKGVFVVVMSGYSDKAVIERAFDLGCHDYFEKGAETSAIKSILEKYKLFKTTDWEKDFFENSYVTHSEIQRSLIKKSFPIIATDVPIFIQGEHGSGKTHLAKALHEVSGRAGIFIEIDCSNIKEKVKINELFNSEFGLKNREANKVTVFFNEISALAMDTQEKLLHCLDNKKIDTTCNFRIMATCSENLLELVEKKKFRRDLFYRLAGVSIYLLPLRERPDDIIPLIDQYLGHNKISFSTEAINELQAYSWPGNIKELNNLASFLIKYSSGRVSASEIRTGFLNLGHPVKHSFLTKEIIDYANNHGLRSLLALLEREVTRDSLAFNKGCMTKVLLDLKISRRQFYRAVDHLENNHNSVKVTNI
jgi:two-component system response regulator AtoC